MNQSKGQNKLTPRYVWKVNARNNEWMNKTCVKRWTHDWTDSECIWSLNTHGSKAGGEDKFNSCKPQIPREVSPPRHEPKALASWPQKFLGWPHFPFNRSIIQHPSAESEEYVVPWDKLWVEREELNGSDYIVFTIRSQIITYYVAKPPAWF